MESIYLTAIAIAGGVAALWGLYKNIIEIKGKLDEPNKKQNEQIAIIKDGLASLLRDRISNCYFKCSMEAGYITESDLAICESLYASYKALGGNGVITREVEEIRRLPIQK